MGGPGSTRWFFHQNKTLVEDCFKITIYFLKPYLNPGCISGLTWTRGDIEVGNIAFQVNGRELPTSIRPIYTVGDPRYGEKVDLDYSVPLQTTMTVWGSLRYWFTCPLITGGLPCARRIGALYLPSGGHYFGCRHCYDLTYRSSRESKIWDNFFTQMAFSMQDTRPGITGADIRYLLGDLGKPPDGYYQRLLPFRV